MRTRVPADSLVGRVILSTRFQPGAVVGVGLVASLFIPLCVLLGGPVILVSLPLIAITALADASYALLAARSTSLSRRVMVFEPLAARLSEGAWLLALWFLGAPGWCRGPPRRWTPGGGPAAPPRHAPAHRARGAEPRRWIGRMPRSGSR